MSKKVMKLMDPRTGLMECKVCGDYHIANIKPDSHGHFYRGSWQCRHGCRLEDIEKPPNEIDHRDSLSPAEMNHKEASATVATDQEAGDYKE